MSETEIPSAAKVPSERPGPAGGKRERNRRRRITSLREAGLELFLGAGVERVTIDEIAQRAGLAKGSFYRYFESRRALVEGIFEPVVDAVRSAMERCERELDAAETESALFAAYEGLGAALVILLASYRDEVLLYLQECRAPGVGDREPIRALADEIGDRAIRITRVARKRGLLRPTRAEISALAVVGAGERLLFEFLSGRDLGDPTEAVQTLVTMVLEGVRQPEA